MQGCLRIKKKAVNGVCYRGQKEVKSKDIKESWKKIKNVLEDKRKERKNRDSTQYE